MTAVLGTVPGVGLEEIAGEAFMVLHEGLNDEIAAVEMERVPFDQRLDEARGRQYQAATLEPVERGNFHLGHIPSLIVDESGWTPPLEWFPSVSVMAYRSAPAPGSALFDHGDVLADSLYVETIVKAGPEDTTVPGRTAEVCDKRIWRTVEAIYRVLQRSQDLNGTVQGLENPTVVVSEVFTRPGGDRDQNTWFWQAGRVEYVVTKFSPFE